MSQTPPNITVQDLAAISAHAAELLGDIWFDVCVQRFNPIKGGPGSGNPDQARDDHGRWTGSGSGGSGSDHHYPNHVPNASIWESPCPGHSELECVQEKIGRLGKLGDTLADLFLFMSEAQRKEFLTWLMAGAQPPIPDITTAVRRDTQGRAVQPKEPNLYRVLMGATSSGPHEKYEYRHLKSMARRIGRIMAYHDKFPSDRIRALLRDKFLAEY